MCEKPSKSLKPRTYSGNISILPLIFDAPVGCMGTPSFFLNSEYIIPIGLYFIPSNFCPFTFQTEHTHANKLFFTYHDFCSLNQGISLVANF